MRFEAEHRFAAPAHVVLAVLVDVDFQLGLSLPDLGPAELVAHQAGAGVITLGLRYEYVGQLDPRARRLLGGGHLTWVQELRVDVGAGSGTLRMHAEAVPSALRAEAEFTVLPDDGGGAVRRLFGELVVAVPVIGALAERRIVPGVLGRLDVEATALAARAAQA